MRRREAPLITRDPVTGGELVVTRLESPDTGITIEGWFRLGWIGRLTVDQLQFVGVLLMHRANLQKVAAELQIAYNTARSRLDDIVVALGGGPEPPTVGARNAILEELASGDIDVDEALKRLS